MLQATCCCGSIFAIVIYNSNAAADDNFKVVLNGTLIGQIVNNTNSITGRIFAEDAAGFTSADISVIPNNFQPSIALDMTLLINGGNTLRIESIVNNFNGNFGNVRIGFWTKNTADKYELLAGNIKLDTNYSFASGVGNGNDFTFSYAP